MTITISRSAASRFSRVPNSYFESCGLSPATGFVHLYLLSKPAHWVVRIHNIATVFKMSDRSARRVMLELVEAGYARRFAVTEDGVKGAKMWDYEVSDAPIFKGKTLKPEVLVRPSVAGPPVDAIERAEEYQQDVTAYVASRASRASRESSARASAEAAGLAQYQAVIDKVFKPKLAGADHANA